MTRPDRSGNVQARSATFRLSGDRHYGDHAPPAHHRRRVARRLRARARARCRVHDAERIAGQGALHRRGRARRPRLSRHLSLHARRVPLDVPRAAVDDAPVRGLRHRRGDQRALPLPARPRPGRAEHRLRHAVADGLRLRSRGLARRGRSRGRRRRHRRRHGDALRRHRPRRDLGLDDDQRARRGDARLLRRGRRGAGDPRRAPARDDPGRHPQGVHRPEGVVLPRRPGDAPVRRHDRVVHRADAALAPDQRLGLSHPRGRIDGRAGAGVHDQGRPDVRRAGDRARPERRRLRAAPELLLQRPGRLLRGDRQVPRRPADLGARAARALRRRPIRARGGCASTRRRRACRSPPSSR